MTEGASPERGRDGDRAALAGRYAEHLSTSAVERGLIGPREVPRLWERHLLNCAAAASLVPEGSRVMDVGSGAGLPGLVLAVARPDIVTVLVEPLQRRVTWLDEVVADLGLTNVRVHRGRAEEVRGLGLFDVVTARAVAALEVLAGWCLPHVRRDGLMLALKGQSAQAELVAAESRLRGLGASAWSVELCGGEVLAEPTTVVQVVAGIDGAMGLAAAASGRRSSEKRAAQGGRRQRGSGPGSRPGAVGGSGAGSRRRGDASGRGSR